VLCGNENIISSMVPVTACDAQSIEQLEAAIDAKIELLMAVGDVPFVLNQRHYNLIMTLDKHLHTMNALLVEPVAYELISYHLQESLVALSDLTGKTVSEQGMDAVFREFCVGK
jgi:tRNA modification GTPase